MLNFLFPYAPWYDIDRSEQQLLHFPADLLGRDLCPRVVNIPYMGTPG